MAFDNSDHSSDSRTSGNIRTSGSGLAGPWRLAVVILAILLIAGIAGWLVFGRTDQVSKIPEHQTQALPSGHGVTAQDTKASSLEKAEIDYPSFDIVRVSRGGTGVIAGRAPPGSNVEILADGNTLGRVTADDKGDWVLIFDEPLKTGGVELSLKSVQPGQSPVESKSIVVVVVPKIEKEHFLESEGEGVVAIMSPRDKVGHSVIMQRPGPVSPGEVGGGLALDAVDYDDSGHAIISGRAAANAEVRIYLDNKFVGPAQADDKGVWRVSPANPVSLGRHVLRVDQVIEDGDVQVRLEAPFDRSKPLNLAEVSGQIVVQPGNSLWHISRKIFGSGFQYTTIFKANQDQIKDPDLIYPGQVFELPASENTKNTDTSK